MVKVFLALILSSAVVQAANPKMTADGPDAFMPPAIYEVTLDGPDDYRIDDQPYFGAVLVVDGFTLDGPGWRAYHRIDWVTDTQLCVQVVEPLVGRYRYLYHGEYHEVLVAPVPEPRSWLLASVGLVALRRKLLQAACAAYAPLASNV